MWAAIAVAFPLLGWLAAQAPLTRESAIVLAVSAPLIGYYGIAGIDLSLRVGTRSPFRTLSWDCLDVVAVPLALVVPAGQAAVCVALVEVATLPIDPVHPATRNRLYSAAVNGLAIYAAGEFGRQVITAVDGDLGVCVAVAVGVLAFELLTFVAHMAFMSRGDPHISLILRPAVVAVPLVIAFAIGITLAYVHGAYATSTILACVPVLLIEVMRRFGRTSVDLSERNRERDEILRAVVEAAELQRSALAADVHDGPLQSVLACQALLADIAEGSVAPDSDAFARAREWLAMSAEELRSLVRGLVPELLRELGLEGAIERDAQMLARPPLQTIGLDSQVNGPVPPTVEIILYRVAHEALMNAVKHSRASHIAVQLRCGRDGAAISVVDDGRGGATAHDDAKPSEGHVGLAMVRDRIQLAGGTFEVSDGADGGTRVAVTLPPMSEHPEPQDSRAARLARWWAATVSADEVTVDR